MHFIRGAARVLATAALVSSGAVMSTLPALAESGAAPDRARSATAAAPATAATATDCGPARPRQADTFDGFRLGWLPKDLGPLVSDFEYEWEEVQFRSRVWEAGPDPDGAYRVDLQAVVMRSPALSDPAALRDFLVDYLERDPDEWATEPFDHPDGAGFADADEIVWLAAPGVAVRVHAGDQVGPRDLRRTACAMRLLPVPL